MSDDLRIDHLLHWATVAWEDLPRVEREIDTWRLEDQLVFTEEWALEEDRLLRLAELALAGQLSASQCERYRRLLELVEQRRPIIERLLRS